MPDFASTWSDLCAHLLEIETLDGVGELLMWDQQTMMPPKAAAGRGHQMALVARLRHARMSDPRVGRWLDTLRASQGALDDVQRAALRVVGRAYDRSVGVPEDLVDALSRARAEGFTAWLAAKQASDFSLFAPNLRRLLDLTLRWCEAVDPHRHPYEVMLEASDPGVTVAELRPMFARLRDGLVALLDALGTAPQIPPLQGSWQPAAIERLAHEVAAQLGYDFDAGRMDEAEHPFSVTFGPGDVRITTNIRSHEPLTSLGATVHEAGHAMYEQGLPRALAGTFVGKAASMGLHESQSRFWENQIAKSMPFCEWVAPLAQARLGDPSLDAGTLYRAQNRVARSLIRVSADEVTYNLHVIVRFELELALFEGSLAVDDLPAAWDDKYASVVGVRPPDAATGVLQDVHWSEAAFGYFPSYTLGNLYAASLAAAMQEALPGMWDEVEQGRFESVLAWLRENVHRHGHMHEAPDLVRRAVGERDAVRDLLDHLWARHGGLYGVAYQDAL